MKTPAICTVALLCLAAATPTSAFSMKPRSDMSINARTTTTSSSSSTSTSTTSSDPTTVSSRRQIVQGLISAAAILSTTTLSPSTAALAAAAKEEDPIIDVYFGCGCFWHVQHELVEAERMYLGRKDDQITARTGYAGGKAGAVNGKVCYHNAAAMQSDYGALGHAEVVALSIPTSAFPQFVIEYTNLFSKEGYRPDQLGDRGSEYRNLVGIPGGTSSPLAQQMIDASKTNGDKLDFAKGKGDDPDARGLVFVMDTADYPFYVAEQYHQFHDGFALNENYPNSYNGLASKLAKQGTLGESSCPNGLLGIGALGL